MAEQKNESGAQQPEQRPRPMTIDPASPERAPRKRKTQDEKLDEALMETFPASDPAVTTPRKS